MSQASPSPVTEGDTNQKCIDRPLIATTHKHLGIDEEGFHHHANEPRGLVYRIGSDGEIERVTDLAGRHLDTYIDFVAAQVGWADRHIIKSKALLRGPGGCSSDAESETRAYEEMMFSQLDASAGCTQRSTAESGDRDIGRCHQRGDF